MREKYLFLPHLLNTNHFVVSHNDCQYGLKGEIFEFANPFAAERTSSDSGTPKNPDISYHQLAKGIPKSFAAEGCETTCPEYEGKCIQVRVL